MLQRLDMKVAENIGKQKQLAMHPFHLKRTTQALLNIARLGINYPAISLLQRTPYMQTHRLTTLDMNFNPTSTSKSD